jgi:enoyl-CoA hydratase
MSDEAVSDRTASDQKRPDGTRVRYETPRPGVARLVLTQPGQDRRMIYELNDGFDRAGQDDDIKVIILAADGDDFSTGHVLRASAWRGDQPPVGCWGNFDAPGVEGLLSREEEWYLTMCWRWRNIPKPTIAQVQGRVVAGGLMFIWPCDLIVASADAVFSDPVATLGLNGQEYFAHLFELGARRAKDILFTGRALTASEAFAIGMVSRVVERSRLEAATLDLAGSIAARPLMALKLAKLSVNQSQEAQGLWTAVQAAYAHHLLGHSNNMIANESWVDRDGVEEFVRLCDSPEVLGD